MIRKLREHKAQCPWTYACSPRKPEPGVLRCQRLRRAEAQGHSAIAMDEIILAASRASHTEALGSGLMALVGQSSTVMLKAMADPELKAKTKKRPFLPAGSAETAKRVDEVLKFYLKYKSALGKKG